MKISVNDIFYAHPKFYLKTGVLSKEYEYRIDANL